MNISGTEDDTKIAIISVVLGLFALVVLSPTVGIILFAYGITYAVLISRKPPFAYQFSRSPRNLMNLLGIPVAVFLVFVFVNDFIVGNFNFGSSLALYSSALSPIITIDTPIVKFAIWGILIPVLETFLFIGVVGFMLAKQLKVTGLQTNRIDTYIIIAVVGAIAAVFHLVSQLTMPELLIMDMILFGAGMGLTLKYQELKQAAFLHIFVHSAAMLVLFGVI